LGKLAGHEGNQGVEPRQSPQLESLQIIEYNLFLELSTDWR